jgi:glycosyltransferase involved in cell wall biosynthesis
VKTGRTKNRNGRPRIAYVVNSLNLGGAETLVVQMSRALRDDCDIVILCLDEPGLWAEEMRREGFPVYCTWRQPGIDLNTAYRIAAFCKRHRIDLIHAHQCTPWFYSGLSRYLYPRPRLLFEEHGRFYPEVDSRKRVWVNRMVIQPRTHRVTAVSEDVKNRLVRYEGISADKIAVVYNGVTPPTDLSIEEKAALRQSVEVPTDAFLVGSVGRIDPIKNYGLLVDSLADIMPERRNVWGIVVGDGPSRGSLERQIAKRGLEDRFKLPGYRSDAKKLIQCMDVFVLCSVSEGTSMALLEAMTAGVPVVVTDVGGNPEIVIRDKTGWVVPSNDRNALAGAISAAAGDPRLAGQYARAGKERYERRFRFQTMIRTYLGIYEGLLGK